MVILKLVRPINLLLIALMQFFVEFGLIDPLVSTLNLSSFHFFLLCIATICIAAGGNIINDIYDVEIDLINKPDKVLIGTKISEKNAVRWYITFTVIGVCLGFYLANVIDRPGFAALFVIISALLYLYASYFKGILLLGNIIISLLVSMSIILVGLFELLPELGNSTENAIHRGILNGVIQEIDGVISQYKTKYQKLTVVLTGGDTIFLAKNLKSSIFAIPNFLLEGLNSILIHNIDE